LGWIIGVVVEEQFLEAGEGSAGNVTVEIQLEGAL
jgi:hypothetical protein